MSVFCYLGQSWNIYNLSKQLKVTYIPYFTLNWIFSKCTFLGLWKDIPIAFTLNSMIFSQLMESYLSNVWNMEFCKIPNFGTVTMKTSIFSYHGNHYDSEKNPNCKQKKLLLTFLPNIKIQRFSVETINNIITLFKYNNTYNSDNVAY